MNAPLSRFLVEFAGASSLAGPLSDAETEVFEAEPLVTLTAEAFEQQLGEAREVAAAAARTQVETELRAAFDEERAAQLGRFEAEREAWAREQGQALGESLTTAVASLETAVSEALAAALRPLFEETCRTRVLAELDAAVRALLGDPGHPSVRIEGPLDLLTAFGDAHGSDLALDYVVSDHAELTIIADGTRIATRLSDCLACFSITEG